MQERLAGFSLEMTPGRREIEIKDSLGIKTQDGVIDIQINPNLLKEDLLAAVNRSEPQFLENAREYLPRLKIYMGARPISDVLVDSLDPQSNLAAEEKVLKKTLCEALLFISYFGSDIFGVFSPNEKAPFFYFDVPLMIKRWGYEHLPGAIYTSWLHERQHFVDFVDPVKRSHMREEAEQIWRMGGGIDGLFWLLGSAGFAKHFYQSAKTRMNRRTFFKAVLKGVGLSSMVALASSPLAFLVSRRFTYFENNESETRARRAESEGTLVAQFEEIFQIKLK